MDEYRIFHTGRSENVGLVLALSEDQLNGNAARSALRHHMGASEEKLFAAKIINTVLLELKTDKHGRIEALRLEVPGQIEGFGRYSSCGTQLTEIANFAGITRKLIDDDISSI